MTLSTRTARFAAAALAAGLGAATLAVVAAPAVAGAATKTVQVTENGKKITLSKTSFSPGKYTFVVTNKGKGNGTFKVSGPGVSGSSKTIAPGKSAKVTVTFKNGSYTLEDAGRNMVSQTVTVSGSSSSSGGNGGYGY